MARWFDAIHPDHRDAVLKATHPAGNDDLLPQVEYRMRRHDGEWRWVRDTSSPWVVQGHALGHLHTLIDITDYRRDELLGTETGRLLAVVNQNEPLERCLTEVTAAASRLHEDARAAVVIAQPDRRAIAGAVSAHLPPLLGEAIRGAEVKKDAIGTCGRAIALGEPVACPDIAADRVWAPQWRELCLALGVRACLSHPVFGPRGEAVASFMLCLSAARVPGEWEKRVASFGADLAAIALRRDPGFQAPISART